MVEQVNSAWLESLTSVGNRKFIYFRVLDSKTETKIINFILLIFSSSVLTNWYSRRTMSVQSSNATDMHGKDDLQWARLCYRYKDFSFWLDAWFFRQYKNLVDWYESANSVNPLTGQSIHINYSNKCNHSKINNWTAVTRCETSMCCSWTQPSAEAS